MIDLGRFLTRRIRLFLVVVLAVALLGVVMVVVVHIVRAPAKRPVEPLVPLLQPAPEKEASAFYGLEVPDEIERYLAPELRYYRENRARWTKEEIDRFWKDPRELGIEVLKKENRKKLRELLDSVP